MSNHAQHASRAVPGHATITHAEALDLLARDLAPSEHEQLELLVAAMEAQTSAPPRLLEVGELPPPLSPVEDRAFRAALRIRARVAGRAPTQTPARTAPRARGAGRPAGRRSGSSNRGGDSGDDSDGKPSRARVFPRANEISWAELAPRATLHPRRQTVLGEEVAS